jgi:hypothetical protein
MLRNHQPRDSKCITGSKVAALLSRAEARVALTSPSVDLRIRIGLMVDVGAVKDPTTASLAADTCRLLEETF